LRRARSNIEEAIKGIFLLKRPSPFINSEPIEGSPERPSPSRGDRSYNFFRRGKKGVKIWERRKIGK
jgi:hypothetical protein